MLRARGPSKIAARCWFHQLFSRLQKQAEAGRSSLKRTEAGLDVEQCFRRGTSGRRLNVTTYLAWPGVLAILSCRGSAELNFLTD